MIYRTFLDRFNTIVEGSNANVGASPVATLMYGDGITRLLLHFNTDKIKGLYDTKVIPDLSKAKHLLKITNCGNLEADGYLNVSRINNVTMGEDMMRAASFEIIAFTIPLEWDGGNGYDFCESVVSSQPAMSYNGASWYNNKTGSFWNEAGVYCPETLAREYEKYCRGENSIIIGRQSFDTGNESVEIDVTKYVNAVIAGTVPNRGIGIAISPVMEQLKTDHPRFVSFFTNNTHTFFHPYIETRYDDVIVDDRNHFYLDKDNRLYLYCNVGQSLENLDEMPVCTIDGTSYQVKQATKGVYYIDIKLGSDKYEVKTMLYDKWSNLKYKGQALADVEMDFVVLSQNVFFNMSNMVEPGIKYVPEIYGFKDSEIVQQGDVRKVNFLARVPYSKNKFACVDNMEMRLYVKDGNGEFDVIGYDKINRTFNENYYMLDTSTLIPNTYYIDVRVTTDQEVIVHHDLVHFTIKNNLTGKYGKNY